MKPVKLSLVYLICIFITQPIWAKQKHSPSPVKIQAQTVKFNNQTHQGLFFGQVQVKQKDQALLAKTLTTEWSKSGKLRYLKAIGKQAKFTDKQNPKEQVEALANQIEYFPQKGLVVLTGRAQIRQGKHLLKNDQIKYSVTTSQIISSIAQHGRPKIVLHKTVA